MIFFCDIDGVLLPGRAYYLADQTWPLQSTFDPCVVGMLNRLCKELGGKIVIHSNWRGTEERRVSRGLGGLPQHFVAQGIRPEYMHSDPLCPLSSRRDRWTDIPAWLHNHPEVSVLPGEEGFWILEDLAPPQDFPYRDRVIQTDFDQGLTVAQYLEIQRRSGGSRLLLPGQNGG